MLNKYLDWMRSFSFFGISLPNNMKFDSCIISIKLHEAQLVCAKEVNNKKVIQWIETIPYRKISNLSYNLKEFVKKHQLEGAQCTWVLEPEHYQILLLDALPVAESEFQAAIRWKIKEIIPFPLDDAVIDAFPMPQAKLPGANKMISVVVSSVKYLQPLAEQIQKSGLHLHRITISLLSLSHVLFAMSDAKKTSVLIYMSDKNVQLLIVRENTLYFQRQFHFGLEAMISKGEINEDNPDLDNLALELQRSYDYYQSQWREPPPTRVFLTTTSKYTHDIARYLTNKLSVEFVEMDLKEKIQNKDTLSIELQGRYLPLIGEILLDKQYAAGH